MPKNTNATQNLNQRLSKNAVLEAFLAKKLSAKDFKELPLEYRDDEDVARLAVSFNKNNFKHLSERLRSDGDFVFNILHASINPNFGKPARDAMDILKSCTEQLTNDKAFMLRLAKNGMQPYEYASKELKKDKNFFKECWIHLPYALLSMELSKVFKASSTEIQEDDDVVSFIYKHAVHQFLSLMTSNTISRNHLHRLRQSHIKDPLSSSFYKNQIENIIVPILIEKEKMHWDIQLCSNAIKHCAEHLTATELKALNEQYKADQTKTVFNLIENVRLIKELKEIQQSTPTSNSVLSNNKKRKVLKVGK